ncbi:MAG: response regulator transcription factor [Gammaproteobacteria bacterium]|nr:response regulator transcription factor [Gammaproteobacteria bacterium]
MVVTDAEGTSALVVDDDAVFRRVLASALTCRGFSVVTAESAEDAVALARLQTPEYAVVNLNLPGDSGLILIRNLLALNPATRAIVLTGYASITTAVEAIKLGAVNDLAKPADMDQVLAAFTTPEGNCEVPVNDRPLSVNRLEWGHIQRILRENDGSISATARQLRMHRRTLQRKLHKRPAKF